ncbi:uncharacterized protein LOC113305519 [Papaver somniferum]|uniref:uncharacterized protein LOC113305519 n=1 Tax=Papaver somniferum TaxID=3469 RepID=UPI000E702637|nr:uncharacterized protein LOC113305519 [Papaver somniferum]
MVETVMGVAKVAFEAVEFKHNHLDHHHDDHNKSEKEQQYHQALSIEEEKKLKLFAAVESTKFLNQLESLHQASNNFPFEETTEADLVTVEILVNGERSRWVWVTDEKLVEERSGIDNETYVIVSEDDVVEGVANFMAKCIISNPKTQKLTPQELQKTVAKALEGVNRMEQLMNIWHAGTMFYGLAMWGLALSGLYRHRGVLKVAAKGIGASGKLVMKAL